eukprot:CAMPEP_0119005790 /NCGR_PEP_ID=MMETSP1176-20130426/1932_1 /TAXON_ID=265551 /ORGANISM="Synedropsis recta cf, Strain CCMP1620" /LENGTH=576 /DNA_ID=CAMNT_0006957635 /DNA_START=31 /DNA_END=1757 /DNA_ORIENTATION=-
MASISISISIHSLLLLLLLVLNNGACSSFAWTVSLPSMSSTTANQRPRPTTRSVCLYQAVETAATENEMMILQMQQLIMDASDDLLLDDDDVDVDDEPAFMGVMGGEHDESVDDNDNNEEEQEMNDLMTQSDDDNNDDNNDDDDNDDDDNDDGTKDNKENLKIRRQAMTKLLLSGTGARRQNRRSSSSNKEKTTSVGARRVGSASRNSGLPNQSQILTGIRRAATAAANANSSKNDKNNDRGDTTTNNNNATRPPLSQLVIDRSIDSFLKTTMMTQQRKQQQQRTAGVDYSQHARAMGLLGAVDEATLAISHPLLQMPQPGTFLIESNSNPNNNDEQQQQQSNIIRCATHLDDTDIAHLRLSVFSDFSPALRQQFCSRSRQVLTNRRLRGATCLVATTTTTTTSTTNQQQQQVVLLGSMECSVHEFYGTILGQRRKQNSVLYITEVAVNPLHRRCGVGTQLMEGVIELATKYRGVESLYLHVDVTNEGALRLYQDKMGFTIVNHPTDNDDDDHAIMYNDFTTSLNLQDGATRGRNHYLLCKDLRKPTWLSPETGVLEEQPYTTRGASRPPAKVQSS